MNVCWENQDFRIESVESQQSDLAIVVFAGIGPSLDGVPVAEFSRSLQSTGLHLTTYFVIDKSRTWYNHSFDLLRHELRNLLDGIPNLTIGNSMGGFAAILFSTILPNCLGTVAFVPQYSVHPFVAPNEHRWDELIAGIKNWNHANCVYTGSNSPKQLLLFGSRDLADLRQLKSFMNYRDAQMSLLICDGFEHNLASELNRSGLLVPLLTSAISQIEDVEAIRNLLESSSVATILGTGARPSIIFRLRLGQLILSGYIRNLKMEVLGWIRRL